MKPTMGSMTKTMVHAMVLAGCRFSSSTTVTVLKMSPMYTTTIAQSKMLAHM